MSIFFFLITMIIEKHKKLMLLPPLNRKGRKKKKVDFWNIFFSSLFCVRLPSIEISAFNSFFFLRTLENKLDRRGLLYSWHTETERESKKAGIIFPNNRKIGIQKKREDIRECLIHTYTCKYTNGPETQIYCAAMAQ